MKTIVAMMPGKMAILMKTLIICLFVIGFLTLDAMAEESAYKFRSVSLHDALKEIAGHFNAVIITDPALDGPVPKEVNASTLEAVLKKLLDPLGYSFTKVENYYIVSGPNSPLTLLAETESMLVPVGFLDPQAQEKLGDLKKYLTYDQTNGIAYVKAPSSRINEILSGLWEVSKSSSELSVVYQLQIVDLGTSSDLDAMFSGKYDRSSAENGLVITPDQWSSDGIYQAVLNAKAEQNQEKVTRRPWLVALPGKTSQITTSLYYQGADIEYERYFKVAITPVKTDPVTGRTVSTILIERNLSDQNKQMVADNPDNAKRIAENTNRVSTTVVTRPGKREIVAVVRQTTERLGHSIIFPPFIGNKTTLEHRDFMIIMTATPVNLQSTLSSSGGLLPIAALGGINAIEDNVPPPVRQKSSLGIGIGKSNNDGALYPWVKFSSPLGERGIIELNYQTENLYSFGLLYNYDTLTSLELAAGKGIGPHSKNAVMLGLIDVKKPNDFIEFYGKYYPFAYLLDSRELSLLGVWEAGTRWGGPKFGLSVSALGDSDFDGCRYKLDFSPKGLTWILGYSTIEKEPEYSMGVKMNI